MSVVVKGLCADIDTIISKIVSVYVGEYEGADLTYDTAQYVKERIVLDTCGLSSSYKDKILKGVEKGLDKEGILLLSDNIIKIVATTVVGFLEGDDFSDNRIVTTVGNVDVNDVDLNSILNSVLKTYKKGVYDSRVYKTKISYAIYSELVLKGYMVFYLEDVISVNTEVYTKKHTLLYYR